MRLCDSFATSQQVEERLLIVVDGGGAAEVRQFSKGVAADWGSEALVDAVDEGGPWRDGPMVLVEAVKPLLGGALEVERGSSNLHVLRCALRLKKLIALVEPSQGIFGSIILGKSQFMDDCRRCGRCGTLGVKVTLLIQNLSLDIIDGSLKSDDLRTGCTSLGVDLLAEIRHQLDEASHVFLELFPADVFVIVSHGDDAAAAAGGNGVVDSGDGGRAAAVGWRKRRNRWEKKITEDQWL